MKRARAAGRGLACALVAALAACAPAPQVGDTEPPPRPIVRAPDPPSAPRASVLARHTELAAKAREAGDLATAADHEEVLVLVAPDDPRHRKALQATREAIRRGVREHAQAGLTARRGGDLPAAREAFLRVLALDPDNADAAKALREIEFAVMSRSQTDRAARARSTDDVVANVRARANDAYDLDQRLELVRAGDLNAVQQLKGWADAHPGDRAGRQRAGAVVAERARDQETKGQRESALALYEQAGAIAGNATPEWTARIQALRKALGEHYYGEGMKAWRTDLAAAIRHFETGVRYDPANNNLQAKLRDAKLVQQKLHKIGQK